MHRQKRVASSIVMQVHEPVQHILKEAFDETPPELLYVDPEVDVRIHMVTTPFYTLLFTSGVCEHETLPPEKDVPLPEPAQFRLTRCEFMLAVPPGWSHDADQYPMELLLAMTEAITQRRFKVPLAPSDVANGLEVPNEHQYGACMMTIPPQLLECGSSASLPLVSEHPILHEGFNWLFLVPLFPAEAAWAERHPHEALRATMDGRLPPVFRRHRPSCIDPSNMADNESLWERYTHMSGERPVCERLAALDRDALDAAFEQPDNDGEGAELHDE